MAKRFTRLTTVTQCRWMLGVNAWNKNIHAIEWLNVCKRYSLFPPFPSGVNNKYTVRQAFDTQLSHFSSLPLFGCSVFRMCDGPDGNGKQTGETAIVSWWKKWMERRHEKRYFRLCTEHSQVDTICGFATHTRIYMKRNAFIFHISLLHDFYAVTCC